MELITTLLVFVIASIVIMYACNSFDDASNYLGRYMAPGIRGATINAIGSSMPEFMTAIFLLFLYHDQGGFAAGIATTAGSAIFNAVVIPAVCIFAVRSQGVMEITVSKTSILRDGFFLLIAEAALIWFLGDTLLAWWMGASLIGIYIIYFIFLSRGFGVNTAGTLCGDFCLQDAEQQQIESSKVKNFKTLAKSKLKSIITLDFNDLLFGGESYSTGSAWTVLSLATIVIAIACWALAESVMISAEILSVPPYFTALVFAAAATSVPDTILSVKDAMRGDYNDSIGNAVGSNTFDITVALGMPLLLYTLIYGDIMLDAANETQSLRIVLFVVTAVVLSLLLLSKKVTIITAWILTAIYISWMSFIVYEVLSQPVA